MKLFEKKVSSNHIKIQEVTGSHEKGDTAILGTLTGLWDYDTDSTNPNKRIYSINTGVPCAIFSATNADITGGPVAVGAIVYMDSTGALTTTASGNLAFGTAVAINGAAVDIAANK